VRRYFIALLLVFGFSAVLMGYYFTQPFIVENGGFFQNPKVFGVALLLLSFSTGFSAGVLTTNILNKDFKVYPIVLLSALMTLFILMHMKGLIEISMYFAVITGLVFSIISFTPYLSISKPDIFLKITLICLLLIVFVQAILIILQDFQNINSLFNVMVILIISTIGIGLAIRIMDK